jgi:hypothetical protein
LLFDGWESNSIGFNRDPKEARTVATVVTEGIFDSTPGCPAVASAGAEQGLRVRMVGRATATLMRGFLCGGAF